MSIDAIRDVSDTLINLLKTNIADTNVDDFNPDDVDVIIASPADIPQEPAKIAIALYLYSIIENPELKNEERLWVNHQQTRRSPLSLDLYYMLTIYPVVSDDINDQHNHNRDAHRTLSRAMRVFYDHGIVVGSMLSGNLRDAEQALRITLNPITVEDLTRIWSVFPEASYRPSVCYLVSPVRVDSIDETTTEQRVVQIQQAQYSMTPRSRAN